MSISNKRQIGESFVAYRTRLKQVAKWLKARTPSVLYKSTNTHVWPAQIKDGVVITPARLYVTSTGPATQIGTRKNPSYI